MDQNPEYEVRLSTHAKRDLDDLPSNDFQRVDVRIKPLEQNPRPRGVTKLWDGAYRVRVGPWRIIYLIDDAKHIVVIDRILRRREDTYR